MRAVGLEDFKEMVAAFRTAFPDTRMTIGDVIVEGDKVVTWAWFTGTHRGPSQGMPPTGKPVKVKDVDLFRIKDGRVLESSTTFDRLGMLKQLGVIAVPEEGEGGQFHLRLPSTDTRREKKCLRHIPEAG